MKERAMNKRCLTLLLVLSVLIVACSKQEVLSPLEYVNWIDNPENKLTKQKEIGDFTFHLTHQPHAYMAFRKLRTQQATEQEVLTTCQDYGEMEYYALKLESMVQAEPIHLASPDMDYEAKVRYFSSDFQNDIQMINGDDTLNCSLFHYERYYGLTPYDIATFAFDNVDKTKARQIIVRDELFSTGPLKFYFKKSEFKKIPQIRYSEEQ